MTTELILFSWDILSFSITLVVLGLLWFADKRNAQVRALITVGVATCYWIVFDSIAMIAQPETYGYFYTLRSIMLVIDPYCLLWFMLSLNQSPLLKSRRFNRIMFAVPAADVLLLLTDPFHHLVFAKHGFPLPEYGPLFVLHSVLAYVAVLLVIVLIFRFIAAQRPSLWVSAILVVFSLMPVVVNVLFTLKIIHMHQDIAPLAFFAIFLTLSVYAYRSRLLSFKNLALSEIFEQYRDPIIFATPDHRITECNRAMRAAFPDFPLTPGRTTLREFAYYLDGRFINPDDGAVFTPAILSGESGAKGQFSIAGGDGKPRTYSVGVQKVISGRHLSGYAITLADVSTYRAMIDEIHEKNESLIILKEQAESASAAKSVFLANISHEIRTPLNAIMGLGQLELRKNLPEETTDNLKKMHKSATGLLMIINDLLDISKIESGRFELTAAEYDVPALLNDVATLNLFRIADKPIEFVLDAAPDLPDRLVGDELRIRQVFSNLLSNAFKYTMKGRVEMIVRSRMAGGGSVMLVCSVTDTGIGIKKEDQPKLFEQYYQAGAQSDRRIEGTGLGLAISKRLAEMMGGGIELFSEYGKGSSFTAAIEQKRAGTGVIGDETARALRELRYGEEKDQRPDKALPQFPGRRVLVVDDVEINLEVTKGMLEAYGVRAECVQSGKEAVELVRKGAACDLIFMDHMMPGMDGIEAARLIREQENEDLQKQVLKRIPIIALTANAIVGNEAMFLQNGFQGMLSKPIEMPRLEAVLRQYL